MAKVHAMTDVHLVAFNDVVIQSQKIKPFLLNSQVIFCSVADMIGTMIQGNLNSFRWIVCMKNKIQF